MENKWMSKFKEHILLRGYDYFEAGAIDSLAETEYGYDAVVFGENDYDVSIFIDGDEIKKMTCTCPYAQNENNCKHMAAALFALFGGEPPEQEDEDTPAAAGEAVEDEVVEEISEVSEAESEVLEDDFINKNSAGNHIFLDSPMYTVEYLRHEVIEDDDGENLLLYLMFHNKTGNSVSCSDGVHLYAYQHGIQIDETYVNNPYAQNYRRRVRSGYSVECAEVFKLRDRTEVIIEASLHDFYSGNESEMTIRLDDDHSEYAGALSDSIRSYYTTNASRFDAPDYQRIARAEETYRRERGVDLEMPLYNVTTGQLDSNFLMFLCGYFGAAIIWGDEDAPREAETAAAAEVAETDSSSEETDVDFEENYEDGSGTDDDYSGGDEDYSGDDDDYDDESHGEAEDIYEDRDPDGYGGDLDISDSYASFDLDD